MVLEWVYRKAKSMAKKKKTAKKAATKKKTTKAKAAKKGGAKKVAKKVSKKKAASKKTSNKKKAAAAKKADKKVSKKKLVKKAEPKKIAKKIEKVVAKKPAKGELKKVSKKETPKAVAAKPEVAEKVETKTKATAIPQQDLNQPSQPIKIEKDIVLTDAEGRILCRVRDCDQPAVVEAYCRYHYLLFWKKIQIRRKILSEGKLEKYIEELTSRYPNKYLDLIKRDLSTEADFLHAIQELEIDESSSDDDSRDYDEERSFIEEVRGVSDNNDRDQDEY